MTNNTSKYLLENQETERLIFRKVNESDFDTWLEFCKDPDSLKYIPMGVDNDPYNQCKVWFERVFNRYNNGLGGMNALIDKTSNLLVGQCGLLIQEVDGIEELEIGYSIMPDHRGKGYATEAAKKSRDFAFENKFSDSLISVIDIGNDASVNVAQKNGMYLEKSTMFKGTLVNIYRIKRLI